jgi:predicted O-methyltransferase YrrM
MEGGATQPGSCISGHMPTLYLLAKYWSFGEVVELGVGRGFSTLSLLSGILDGEGKGNLTSYDANEACRSWALESMGLREGDPRLTRWKFVKKDSVEAAEDFGDGQVSLWFLDTSHYLEATRNELAAWFPKLHPRGVMCGHDYFLDRNPRFPGWVWVRQAVDEFAKANAGRFRLQAIPESMGLWILWPKVLEMSLGG